MPTVSAEMFAFDEVEAQFGRRAMNEMLLDKVRRERPDLVFFFFYQDEFDPRFIDRIGEVSPTVNWFADDQWRFHSYSKHWARHLTWVATTHRPAAIGYRRLGFQNVILTQWACNHFSYKPLPVGRDIEVSFVGQSHGSRREIIEWLAQNQVQVLTRGSGWQSGRVSQDEMIRIFSRSKVNLNLSNASADSGVMPIARILFQRKGRLILPRGRTLPDKFRELRAKRQDQIKGRNFEIPGCAGFLLTNSVPGLEEYFDIGQEVVIFDNADDLRDKIKYFQSNDTERETIAKAGYRRTVLDHTYEKRFTDLFQIIGIK